MSLFKDMELLDQMVVEGYVRRTVHPSQPLAILNYTEKTQFSGTWNEVTLACRGLIYNTDTLDIVARPFPKFFNYGERWQTDQLSLDEPVIVTDKMDGSLGILYEDVYGELAIATRGSFTSEQAKHATELLHRKYPDYRPWMRGTITTLFEIVYPENRIVVDYDGLDDLVMIGGVSNYGTAIFGPEFDPAWPGPCAEILSPWTLREALRMDPRPGKEGLVVRSLMDNTMVKIKQDDYVALHRLVTNLNPRVIWERSMEADLSLSPDLTRRETILGGFREKVLEGVPDEWFETVWLSAREMFQQVNQLRLKVEVAWKSISILQHGDLDDRRIRGLFARMIRDFEPWLQKALWLRYDYKQTELRGFLWKQIKPRGDDQ